MLVPVLLMFAEAVNSYKAVAAAEDTTVAVKIRQAEKHIGFRNNNHQG
jgi:hypothetical protein